MAYSISWLVPERVLQVEVQGSVHLDQITDMNAAVLGYMQSAQAPVHLIISSRDLQISHLNIRMVQERITLLRSPRIGWIVFTVDHSFVRFFAAAVTQFARFEQVRFVPSVEVATSLLNTLDPTLHSMAVSVA
jgi:hypothetical protein